MSDADSRPQIRPLVKALGAYKQGKPAPENGFKLSSNENPYPPLPSVIAAVEESLNFNRYPDGSAASLKSRLAEVHNVDTGRILVGPGSITVLLDLLLTVAGAGDEVEFPWRSFEGYPQVVSAAGAESVKVPLNPDLSHDLEGMLAAVTDRTKAVLLCSPNNPTGNVLGAGEVERFLAELPPHVLVVLDEAYTEFVRDEDAVNGMKLVDDYQNLAVVRTFSKAHGLAGLRIGYAVAPAHIVEAANTIALPLATTEIAQVAAIASLDARAEMEERVEHLVTLRSRLEAGLVAQGWELPASHGNFVWIPTGERTSEAEDIFLEHGIVVRAFPPEGIRVSIGEDESLEVILEAAEAARALLAE